MTDKFKEALDSLEDRYRDFYLTHFSDYEQSIGRGLFITLATEAEQLRKERDELAAGIIRIHEEDNEGDIDFIKFITKSHYELAKKVNENGNA